MTDTITADEYRTAAKVARTHGDKLTAEGWEERAARLEAESARDEYVETLANLYWEQYVAEDAERGRYRFGRLCEDAQRVVKAGIRAVLDRLAADGRLLPEGGTIIDGLIRAIPGETSAGTQCTGAGDCGASPHIHGCFADTGDCDDPGDHPDSGPDGTPEKPWPTWQDVPEGVTYWGRNRLYRWINRGGRRMFLPLGGGEVPSSRKEAEVQCLAPFVRVDGDKA